MFPKAIGTPAKANPHAITERDLGYVTNIGYNSPLTKVVKMPKCRLM